MEKITPILFVSFAQLAALDSLSPKQKAELILDPDSGALENVTIVKQVFGSLTASPKDTQLSVFFGTLVDVTKEVSGSLLGYLSNYDVGPIVLKEFKSHQSINHSASIVKLKATV